jgi:catechol 2,3-dioxygenase-like lactoylglutathione lyase family enzyme
MFNKIHSIAVIVSDQDAALDFYVNTLGWEKRADMVVSPEMRWLTVVPPGSGPTATEMALLHRGSVPSEQCGGNTGISLNTPDIAQAYETLTARGVKFRGPVETMPWGMKAVWFSDPDGNEFFLVEE